MSIVYSKFILKLNIKTFNTKLIYGDVTMDSYEIFSLSLDIGEAIIKSGGEIYRAEDTIKRINKAYNQDCRVFAVPRLIIAQSGKKIEIRKIDKEYTDLAELDRVNSFSRRLCLENSEEISVTKRKIYKKEVQSLSIFLATFSFSLFFGGKITDAFFSGIIGLTVSYSSYKNIDLPEFSSNLIDAFIICVMAHIPYYAGFSVTPDKIIIGAIMLLVPGLTVANAMRDLMNGDLLAGLIELFNSIFSALGIAMGVAGGLFIFNKL